MTDINEMTKKELTAKAVELGLDSKRFWSKSKLLEAVKDKITQSDVATKFSVEVMADMQNSIPVTEKPVKPGGKIKFVDVMWLGSDSVFKHHPPGQNIPLHLHRRTWCNIRLELFGRMSKKDPNWKQKLDDLFKVYSEFYMQEAEVNGSFWSARVRYGPVPVKVINADGIDWVDKAREFMDCKGEEIIFKLSNVTADELPFGNSKPHLLNLVRQLEVEGKHRQTVIDYIDGLIEDGQKIVRKQKRLQL